MRPALYHFSPGEVVEVTRLSEAAIKRWITPRLFALRWGEGFYWKLHFSCVQLPLYSFVLRMFFAFARQGYALISTGVVYEPDTILQTDGFHCKLPFCGEKRKKANAV